jgi:hypothetical protein
MLALVGGCGLIPKRVEFGQDKVERVPVKTAKRLEAERQAVKLAGEKAREAQRIAEKDGSTAAVPAGQAASLSESVSVSLGPPKQAWPGEVEILVARLERMTAEHNEALRKFAEANDKNAGKKIEGTGWLSIPYFVYAGGFVLALLAAGVLLKLGLSLLATMNPGVAVGMKVAKVGGRAVSSAFSEVLEGGEAFKQWVEKNMADKSGEVLDAFRSFQERRQSPQTQTLIKELTKK